MTRLIFSICLITILLISCCAWATDYVLGTEQMIDPTHPNELAFGGRTNPVLASSGSQYFAVWTDLRFGSNTYGVFGTRISSDGTVLDPGGIYLNPGETAGVRPAICWDGASYFVVYGLASRDGAPTRIVYQRVSSAGTLVDPTPVLIAQVYCKNVSVSWDGENHMIVWEGNSSTNGNVYLARVNALGSVLDTTPRLVSGLSTHEWKPLVASTTGKSLIVWEDQHISTTKSDIFGALVDSSGNIISPGGVPIAICATTGSQTPSSVCWAGTDFKVVWNESSGGAMYIKCCRVTDTGTALDPGGIAVCGGFDQRGSAQITRDGTNCLVAWSQRPDTSSTTDVYAIRINSSVTPISPAFPVCTDPESQLPGSAASAGGNFLISWYISAAGDYLTRIQAAKYTVGTGSVGPAFDLALAAPNQETPWVAFSGQEYMAVWTEYRNAQQCVYGAIFREAGEQPSPDAAFPIAMNLSAKNTQIAWPNVAWNGQDFVVTWLHGALHKAARITRTGVVRDPDGIVVANNGATPTRIVPGIASDGVNTLVTTQVGTKVRSVVMDRDGITISHDLEDAGIEYTSVRPCWTGQRYVALTDEGNIMAIAQDGAFVSKYALSGNRPQWITCSGTEVMVVGVATGGIGCQRIGLDGTIIDPVPVVIPYADTLYGLTVVWDGKYYVVSYTVWRPRPAPSNAGNGDILVTRMTSANTQVDSTPIEFTSTSWDETAYICSAAGPKGRSVTIYGGWAGLPHNIPRIKGKFLHEITEPANVGEIRDLPDGARVRMTNQIVTAAFGSHDVTPAFTNTLYVQQDRTCGLRVDTNDAVSTGDRVTVDGVLSNADGERTLTSATVTAASHGNIIPDPLGMNLGSLGGTAPNSFYEPLLDGKGAYNVCLLVEAWGSITYADITHGCFYMNDGANLEDGSGQLGVKVYGTAPGSAPYIGKPVRVIGISGTEKINGQIVRVLRARSVTQAD